MLSIFILFAGTFWEASMDIIGNSRNYEKSAWKRLADYCDACGKTGFGNKFWDQRLAWKNKWKNGNPESGAAFPGSTNVFVTCVDGWHLVKFIWLVHLFTAMILYEPITGHLYLDILLLYMVFGVGHECFFRLLQVTASAVRIAVKRQTAEPYKKLLSEETAI